LGHERTEAPRIGNEDHARINKLVRMRSNNEDTRTICGDGIDATGANFSEEDFRHHLEGGTQDSISIQSHGEVGNMREGGLNDKKDQRVEREREKRNGVWKKKK
jgi:hypothetical protein